MKAESANVRKSRKSQNPTQAENESRVSQRKEIKKIRKKLRRMEGGVLLKDLYEALIARRMDLETMIEDKQNALKEVPEGYLRVNLRSDRNGWQYYHVKESGDKNGTYIKAEEMNLAKRLAQKEYDKKVLRQAQKELAKVKQCEAVYRDGKAEDIYQNLSPQRQKIVIPIKTTTEQFVEEWKKTGKAEKKLLYDMPEYYTENDEQVRSKSEVLIANMLIHYKIPYQYEKPLELPGMGTIYPDFTILDVKNRRELYWEHLGMMGNEDYLEKALRKITKYEQHQYYLGERLFISYETELQPLNMKVVEQNIKRIKERTQ